MGIHLNCIDKSMQFKWVPQNICLYKEVDRKYTGCNLKTRELLDCALRGVCVVISLNMVSSLTFKMAASMLTVITSHSQ